MSSSSLHQSRHRTARGSSRSTKNRLGAYLAAGLGATTGLTASVDAAIIDIDIGPSGFNIGGVNAGLPNNTNTLRVNFPASGGGPFGEGLLTIFNNRTQNGNIYTGLAGTLGLQFAVISQGPYNYLYPRLFTNGQLISAATVFSSEVNETVFDVINPTFGSYTASDFGPNSYMGFKTFSGNYGWLEVTWTSATNQFQILSGAYESVPGVAIGAGVAAVPEPSTLAMGGVGALVCGGAALRRWRKQKRA